MAPKASTSGTANNRALRPRKKCKYAAGDGIWDTVAVVAVEQKDKNVRKRMTKLGKLAGIMSMPMDVLFEIFGHLRPLDILHLARTTKEFRRVLMHRSSLSIWRAAFDNVPGFPSCPPQMTEPQWANLAFDPHCNLCLTSNTRTVEWRLRLRMCTKCAKEHLEEARHSWCSIWDDDEGEQFLSFRDLVPRRPAKRGNEVVFVDELDSVKAQYLAIEDADARKAFIEERHKLVREIEKHAILCENWVVAQVQTRAEELTELKESRKQGIISRLTVLGWGEEIKKIPYHDDLSNHKLVKQPHLLTDRIWKNISNPMVEYMEKMKANRLVREHAALVLVRKHSAINVLRAYKMAHLPYVEIMPEPVDFCAFPPVKQVLELPSEVDVTESSFDEVVPLLPDLVEEWRTKIRKQLLRKMRGEQKSEIEAILMAGLCGMSSDEVILEPEETDNEMAERMKLAVTVFKCQLCTPTRHSWIDIDDDFGYDDPFNDFLEIYPPTTKPLFYPKVLGHRCLTKPDGLGWLFGILECSDPSVKLDSISSERRKWTCEHLRVDKASGEIVEQVVKACGLDPATTTADDMDELDPRLGCTTCATWLDQEADLAQIHAFRWRAAVQHHSEEHYHKVISWHLLLGDELQQALDAEESFLKELAEETHTTLPSDVAVWSCLLCRDRPCEQPPMAIHQVKAHIKNKHGISDAELNVHYTKDFAAPQVYQTEALAQYSQVVVELKNFLLD